MMVMVVVVVMIPSLLAAFETESYENVVLTPPWLSFGPAVNG
jgi:hypothetical protein